MKKARGTVSPLACVIVAGATGAALVGLLAAQDLGSAARREQERRDRAGATAAPAYTETDLNKGKLPPCPSPTPTPSNRPVAPPGWTFATPTPTATPPCATPTPPVAPSAAVGKATPEPPDARGTETYWRGRAARAREAITSAEASVARLEARVNEVRNDLNPTGTQDPFRMQTRQAELTQAQADLEAAKKQLEASHQALADVEDEARRRGAPPGWLR